MHSCTRASIKFLSSPNFYIIPTYKVQSAKSCTFTHVQVPRSYQDLISRSYFYITSYLQGAKCKILHICTRASIKFLSSPNFHIILTCKLQSARYCTFAHVQVLSSYQDPISSSPPTCKVQSARSCTFAHVQVLSSYQDPISTSPPTCKVQSARSCTFAHKQVLSSYQDPISSSPPICKVQIAKSCTQAGTKILLRPNFK